MPTAKVNPLNTYINFSASPDALRIQQAMKHFFNANAMGGEQPLALIDEFGMHIGYVDGAKDLSMQIVHLASQQGVTVCLEEDLLLLNPVEWMTVHADRWLADYTPDMIEAFELHAGKVSVIEREWYRVNSVTYENKVVLQKRLFETDYWQTVFTMQTHVEQVSEEGFAAQQQHQITNRGAASRALMLRTQFFCEDYYSVANHNPLVQLVISLFLDEDFTFWGNRVEDHGDHVTLTLKGTQPTRGKAVGESYYGVTLELSVEKVDPHSVLSILKRIRDVTGDYMELKDSSQISEEARFGSVHNRAGLNE